MVISTSQRPLYNSLTRLQVTKSLVDHLNSSMKEAIDKADDAEADAAQARAEVSVSQLPAASETMFARCTPLTSSQLPGPQSLWMLNQLQGLCGVWALQSLSWFSFLPGG